MFHQFYLMCRTSNITQLLLARYIAAGGFHSAAVMDDGQVVRDDNSEQR
jgi:hypothetical protein